MTYNEPFYVPIGKGKLNLHTGQVGGYYLPALESKEMDEPEPIVKPTSIYFKMDRGAFELNRRVNELENAYQYLIRKEKEKYASKGKALYKYTI